MSKTNIVVINSKIVSRKEKFYILRIMMRRNGIFLSGTIYIIAHFVEKIFKEMVSEKFRIKGGIGPIQDFV